MKGLGRSVGLEGRTGCMKVGEQTRLVVCS